jgi:hypothetical protein
MDKVLPAHFVQSKLKPTGGSFEEISKSKKFEDENEGNGCCF